MSRHHTFRPTLIQESLALVVLALLLALAFNALRPDPLALFQGLAPLRATLDKAQKTTSETGQGSGQALVQVSPDEAKALLESGQAQFIDARDAATFREGAIPGAINIGPGLGDQDLAARAATLDQNRVLVVYCDGLGCGLSRALARRLQGRGIAGVKVMADGMDGWLKAGGRLECKP